MHKTSKPLWRVKALEYSQFNFKALPHSTDRVRAEKAFIDGLRAYKRELGLEAKRILASIETSRELSQFERGQADGVRWLCEAVNLSWELD